MICICFLCVVSCFFIWVYNKVIYLKNLLLEAESGVAVQLKRRYDLVPNLVRVVSSYCKHETSALENVTQLRAQAMNVKDLEKKEAVENKLEESICAVLVLKENYPKLKANDLFIQLQKDLVLIEDDLQYSRRYYNGVVRKYNIFINLFPIFLFQKVLHVADRPFFQLDGVHEKSVPMIKDYLL